MKKIKIIALFLTLSTCILVSSCDKWLDVLSNEEILEEDAFATTKGFRTALIGAYQIAASDPLWGQELTWGMMSVLSRNYTASSLPTKYKYAMDNTNFESSYTKNAIASIWESGYNVIANCNNIIKKVETTDKPFEYTWEKGMVLAEAKALRALMHFELLRLFAPAPILGNKDKAIPYVTNYPNISPEYKSTSEIIKNIIEDLKYARDILKPIDVDILWGESIMSYFSTMLFYGIQNLQDDGQRSNGNAAGFFAYRGYRLNYWGVTGLLARVYSYNRENDKAIPYVNEIIEEWIDSGVGFEFAWDQKPNNNPNLIDGKRCPEGLICLWNTKVAENYSKAAGTSYFKMTKLNDLFGANDIKEDYRYTAFYNASTSRYRVWDPSNSSYSTDSYIEKVRVILPVLEIPEIYYIKAEYLAEQGKIGEAINTLKVVKDNRNITTPIPSTVNDYNSFMEILINDLSRDFLTRGQTWFYLKKLNWKKMYNGTNVPWEAPDSWFVLPLPDSETSYY